MLSPTYSSTGRVGEIIHGFNEKFSFQAGVFELIDFNAYILCNT